MNRNTIAQMTPATYTEVRDSYLQIADGIQGLIPALEQAIAEAETKEAETDLWKALAAARTLREAFGKADKDLDRESTL